MSILFILSLFLLIIGIGMLFHYRSTTRYQDQCCSPWVPVGVGIVAFILSFFSIIYTGQVGVVRVLGVVKSETLREGLNIVTPWATVKRVKTRGFQMDQTGVNALEVLTQNGTRFSVELSIPVRVNMDAAAAIETNISDGDWAKEVQSLARGLIRNNISGYPTFGEFGVRRTTLQHGVTYGEELAGQIEERINNLFCNTYSICNTKVVDIGEVIIRRVNAPTAITAEAAALEAAKLAKQTEIALNAVEEIRAERRKQEGEGYGNLFNFLPAGNDLSAGDAANFLRAAADKTRADAEAYMNRALSDSLSETMKQGKPLPNIIITTGSGPSPTPVFNTGTR